MAKPKSILSLGSLRGKRVFLRVDFNVPVEDGKVIDDYRIQRTIPTINHLKSLGAKIIIASHFSDPEGESFDIVADYVKKLMPLDYCESFDKQEIEDTLENSKLGVVLLQNLRSHPGEKENSKEFAEFLASFADMYVSEAFAVAHREHASVVSVPKLLHSYMGIVFEEEVKQLSEALNPPENSMFILGGAKFDTKMPLVEKFVNKYKYIVIAGTLANSVFKSQGLNIGLSVSDDGEINLPEKKFGEYIFPNTVQVVEGHKVTEKSYKKVLDNEKIIDAGVEFVDSLKEKIAECDLVLWNGPLGYYEKGYKKGTQELADILSKAKAKTVLGGGDTVAMVNELDLISTFSHVSTGGGAMLDFLADEDLPGLNALK
jgi:phosphoglycerate kinase